MECEICLATSEEGFEIIRLRGGVYLCRDCKEINDGVEEDMAYVDEAMMEMSVFHEEDDDV